MIDPLLSLLRRPRLHLNRNQTFSLFQFRVPFLWRKCLNAQGVQLTGFQHIAKKRVDVLLPLYLAHPREAFANDGDSEGAILAFYL